MSRLHPRMPEIAAVGVLSAAAVVALSVPALAHVTANPNTAVQGSYSKITFRVPNEEQSADTTRLEVDLPLDHPIASVSVRPVPGWTIDVTKGKLPKPITDDDGDQLTQAVTKIVWSGGAIVPGQFQEFDVSMGPLPTDTGKLQFAAVQTYSDGTVVNWNQPTPVGGVEPEHPAPTVTLTKAEPAITATATATATGPGSTDDTARLLGWLGLAAGVVGIAVGIFGLARARSARGRT